MAKNVAEKLVLTEPERQATFHGKVVVVSDIQVIIRI